MHISEIKKFHYDPSIDPALAAIEASQHYIVESIITHRRRLVDNKSSKKNTKRYEFLVHWEGYSDADRTWEPAENLRGNSVWHNYCTENKLTSLIPKRFK